MGWGRSVVRQPDLRLPSIGGGLDPLESRKLDMQEAYRLRLERMRRNIQSARIVYLGEVGDRAKRVIAASTWQTEQYAMRYPEERAGLDMVDETVTMGCLNIVGEMAG